MVTLADSYFKLLRLVIMRRHYDSKSLCFIYSCTVPLYIACWIFYMVAHILIKQHKGNIKILELFDCAIDYSYYGTGWERYMVCWSHIDKALFSVSI